MDPTFKPVINHYEFVPLTYELMFCVLTPSHKIWRWKNLAYAQNKIPWYRAPLPLDETDVDESRPLGKSDTLRCPYWYSA